LGLRIGAGAIETRELTLLRKIPHSLCDAKYEKLCDDIVENQRGVKLMQERK